ncbi:hypothetical protein DM02DRAFT_626801 [Periconia macrospinosa]|uniref:MFS general substrate transporter n=1 Tax=Periconia macrospinosa TaxID=97972 RepID=A0A2V1DZX8_9PLEO|nr:hypothetical protein DM02DRAFT_626801 [Periconia macrospinosa]
MYNPNWNGCYVKLFRPHDDCLVNRTYPLIFFQGIFTSIGLSLAYHSDKRFRLLPHGLAGSDLLLSELIIATVLLKSRTPPSPKPMRASEFAAPFKEPAYLLAITAIFITFLGSLVPYNFLVLQAVSVGVERNLTGYLLSIINSSFIVGRLVPTKLADTYGTFTIMCQVCLLGGILVTAFWILAKSQSGVTAFSALYGLASGGITPLTQAVATGVKLPAEPRTIPVRLGLAFMIVSIPVLISNPIAVKSTVHKLWDS